MNKKRLVMIPGPTPVVRSIQEEMGREMQAFGDPEFTRDFRELLDELNELWNNDGGKTFVIAASGTFGMEMAVANVVKKDDPILIISHGYFGDRYEEICRRKGFDVDVLSAKWGEIIEPKEIEEKLKEKEYKAITVTHVDTSTGVVAPIKEIGEILKGYPETMFIVDGVCSSAGVYEDMKEMNIDLLFTGSQKAFGVCPGLTILWASKNAIDRRMSLGEIPDYYADFSKWIPIMEDTTKYFTTPAVNLIWALKESVRIIKEEGYENRMKRHKKYGDAVQKAVESLGFTILANENNRACTLSNFIYFDDINDKEFRDILYEEGVVVAGALADYAGKAFRLGHMGNVDEHDLIVSIAKIEKALIRLGKIKTEPGRAVGIFLEEITK